MNTIRRTNPGTERDYYQTHPSMVECLAQWMLERGYDSNEVYCDPCCGNGVIRDGLKKHLKNIVGFDKYVGEQRIDYLKHDKYYDIIVMNPPYSGKRVYSFLNHAIANAGMVFCLLPLNIANYNVFHKKYMARPDFLGKILMTPKLFLSETTEFKPGGTASYCWFIWRPGIGMETGYSAEWYRDLRDYL